MAGLWRRNRDFKSAPIACELAINRYFGDKQSMPTLFVGKKCW
jgi:hypothetical protein